MGNWIGYPDDILNTTRLNEIYENVSCFRNYCILKVHISRKSITHIMRESYLLRKKEKISVWMTKIFWFNKILRFYQLDTDVS